MRNKWFKTIVMICALITLAIITPQDSHSEKKWKLSIATGGTGGTYYPCGGGVGELLRKKVPSIDSATAEVTAASVENTNLIQNGRTDLALVAWTGVRGAGLFGKIPNVRSLFWIHGSTVHWAVDKDSDIFTFEDMKGKRLALDAPGSAGMVACNQMFKLFGIDPKKDLDAQYITQGQGVEAFKDGRVDVVYGDVGWPNASFMDLSTTRKVRILTFPPDVLKKIHAHFPELPPEDIPAGTYEGNDEVIHTYTEAGSMICRADLPEELVYEIVKTIHQNQDWLTQNVHKAIGRWSFDPSTGGLAPLHPGAIKYYKEIGLMK